MSDARSKDRASLIFRVVLQPRLTDAVIHWIFRSMFYDHPPNRGGFFAFWQVRILQFGASQTACKFLPIIGNLWHLHKFGEWGGSWWKRSAGRESFQQCVGNSVESTANQGIFASFPQGKLVLSVENLFISRGKLFGCLSSERKNTKCINHLDSLKCIILCKTVVSPREIRRKEKTCKKRATRYPLGWAPAWSARGRG